MPKYVKIRKIYKKPFAKGFFCFWNLAFMRGFFMPIFYKGLIMVESILTGGLYNIALAFLSLLMFRFVIRYLNKRNGYTIDKFIGDCRAKNEYMPIAVLFGSYAVSGALLIGLVIS